MFSHHNLPIQSKEHRLCNTSSERSSGESKYLVSFAVFHSQHMLDDDFHIVFTANSPSYLEKELVWISDLLVFSGIYFSMEVISPF